MLIEALIIDDENAALETLSLLINKYCPEIHIIGQCNTLDEARKKIDSHSPDLIFLDIELSEESGMDLLAENTNLNVIFTTGFDHFAVKAFRLAAVDYLLKPIIHEELIEAVNKYKDNQQGSAKVDYEVLKLLLNKKKSERISIPGLEDILIINTCDLLYIKAARSYTVFHLEDNQQYVASKSLGEIENSLDQQTFFRIHKAHIVNVDHITKYIKGLGGSVVMSDNCVLEVSRRKKAKLMNILNVCNINTQA